MQKEIRGGCHVIKPESNCPITLYKPRPMALILEPILINGVHPIETYTHEKCGCCHVCALYVYSATLMFCHLRPVAMENIVSDIGKQCPGDSGAASRSLPCGASSFSPPLLTVTGFWADPCSTRDSRDSIFCMGGRSQEDPGHSLSRAISLVTPTTSKADRPPITFQRPTPHCTVGRDLDVTDTPP